MLVKLPPLFLLFSPTPVSWSAPHLHLLPPSSPLLPELPPMAAAAGSAPSRAPSLATSAARIRACAVARGRAAQRGWRDSSSAARRRPGARPARRPGACGAPPRPFPPSIRRGGALRPAQALAVACRAARTGAGAARRSADRGVKQVAGGAKMRDRSGGAGMATRSRAAVACMRGGTAAVCGIRLGWSSGRIRAGLRRAARPQRRGSGGDGGRPRVRRTATLLATSSAT